jgi:hypothetical protein
LRKLLCIVCTIGLGALAGSPSAIAATMTLTVSSSEPVESIATQAGAEGATTGSDNAIYLKIKAAGGQGCAANEQADSGETVLHEQAEELPAYHYEVNHTFNAAGSYLLCGWVEEGSAVLALAEKKIAVREPHLSIAIGAPASVLVKQTFQVTTTAQAETGRALYEYALPDTGDGCPANADAANGTSSSLGIYSVYEGWNVDGGPETQTKNEAFEKAGAYLLCAYFEYGSAESPPETAASAKFTVLEPCSVPRVRPGMSLKTVELALRRADCGVGAVHYLPSARHRRGTVIALRPEPGATLPPDTRIQVFVSGGRLRHRRR